MDNPYKISFFIILTTMLSILFANMETLEIPVILAQDKEKNSNETGDIKNTETPSIELTGKLVNNTYRWMDSNDTVNPVLNIVLGQDNKITIKSLPDDPEEHELIIEGILPDGNRDEIIKSDEVEEGSTDIIDFIPEAIDFDSLEYYCEYHPDTMRGNINLINK
jgi:hypothetical protein